MIYTASFKFWLGVEKLLKPWNVSTSTGGSLVFGHSITITPKIIDGKRMNNEDCNNVVLLGEGKWEI